MAGTRRDFLVGLGVAGGIGGGAIMREGDAAVAVSPLLRPPGASDEGAFLAACIRCGQCVEACPFATLNLAIGLRFGRATGTPYLNARKIPCYLCQGHDDLQCVSACPTSALSPVDDLLDIRMGTAVIDEDVCLAYNGTICRSCWHACPYPNRAVEFDVRLRPMVNDDVCIGCGLCDHACPTNRAPFPSDRHQPIGDLLVKGLRGTIARWTWSRRATAAAFLAVLILGRFAWFPWVKGSTTATTLFDLVPLTDPLVAIEFTLASRTLYFDVLVGATILVLIAVVAGPVFCGWACPLGLALDVNDDLRRGASRALWRRGWRLPELRLPRGLKYVALGGVLGFTAVARWPLFQTVSPINLAVWAILFSAWASLGVVLVIAVMEWLAPRAWCRALCPLGALYSIIGRAARWRVWVNPKLAGKTPCGRCTLHCPMGIRVMETYALAGAQCVDHPDCTRCGACIDACPSGVLRLGLRAWTATGAERGVAEHRELIDCHHGPDSAEIQSTQSETRR